jgi:type I restriction enzyme R subunit
MITEDQLEQLCLDWFQSIGYDYICGYDIASDGPAPERADYRQIILHDRLVDRLGVINPHVPAETLEQVALQLAKPETPILIKNNKAFHQFLLEGVKVTFKDAFGEEKTDYVHLIDFDVVGNNQFLWLISTRLQAPRGTVARM